MITSYQLLISLPSSIITLWKKTEGITMKKKDTLSCLSNSLLPWFLLPLQVYSDFLFSKEKTMADIVAILSLICSKEMLMLVPIMIITGYLLKHYTKFPNGYIPVIEMSMGFVLGIVYAVAFNPGPSDTIKLHICLFPLSPLCVKAFCGQCGQTGGT